MSIVHPIPPVFDEDSTVLILGSFPSVRSRAEGFFYGHPQNRFWRVTAAVFHVPVPGSVAEKKDFLHSCGIALYDVIGSCEIVGSSDSSIRQVVPTDLTPILTGSRVRRIFTNGTAADTLYRKYQFPSIGIPAVRLPSTSPANAAWSAERLIEAWKEIAKESQDTVWKNQQYYAP